MKTIDICLLVLGIASCGGSEQEELGTDTDEVYGEVLKISIRAANGQYFAAEGGGGGDVNANRNAVDAWETFKMHDLGGNRVAIQTVSSRWFVCEYGRLLANRKLLGPWETFTKVEIPGVGIALQAHTGQYVVAEGGGGGTVNCNRDWIGPWETLRMNKL